MEEYIYSAWKSLSKDKSAKIKGDEVFCNRGKRQKIIVQLPLNQT